MYGYDIHPFHASSHREHMSHIAATVFSTSMLRGISQAYHHCAIFGMAFGSFRGLLIEFDLLHVQARGGIILLIALIAAITQALLIYTLPKLWSSEVRSIRAINKFAWVCCESFVFMFPLIIFEFLILQVTLGQSLLSADTLSCF